MPRPLRIEYEGARYHVMCRGNRDSVVFASDERKVLLAACIKARYSLANRRIAELLHMGHPTIVSTCGGRVEGSRKLSRQYQALIDWIDHKKH